MYSKKQLLSLDLMLGFLEFIQFATLVAFIINVLYVMFLPISSFTTATIFSVLLSLIAYQGLRAINSYADDIIDAHMNIIAVSLMHHLKELELEMEDGE